MVKLQKLRIKGIRSYDPNKESVVEFDTPVTLICGRNGTGKTTVIECLKFLTMGELPPNGKGGAFIHDPKMAGSIDVRGETSLTFKNGDREFEVTRVVSSTQKGKSLSQKTLECVLADVTDVKKVESIRIADVDKLVPLYLGIQPSIIQNVIFCHQEESTWPIGDPITIKKKLDEIFASAQYNKGLLQLKAAKKDLDTSIKMKKIDLTHALKEKIKREDLKGTIKEITVEIEGKIRKIQKIGKEIQDMKGDLEKLTEKEEDAKTAEKEHAKLKAEIEAAQLILDQNVLDPKFEDLKTEEDIDQLQEMTNLKVKAMEEKQKNLDTTEAKEKMERLQKQYNEQKTIQEKFDSQQKNIEVSESLLNTKIQQKGELEKNLAQMLNLSELSEEYHSIFNTMVQKKQKEILNLKDEFSKTEQEYFELRAKEEKISEYEKVLAKYDEVTTNDKIDIEEKEMIELDKEEVENQLENDTALLEELYLDQEEKQSECEELGNKNKKLVLYEERIRILKTEIVPEDVVSHLSYKLTNMFEKYDNLKKIHDEEEIERKMTEQTILKIKEGIMLCEATWNRIKKGSEVIGENIDLIDTDEFTKAEEKIQRLEAEMETLRSIKSALFTDDEDCGLCKSAICDKSHYESAKSNLTDSRISKIENDLIKLREHALISDHKTENIYRQKLNSVSEKWTEYKKNLNEQEEKSSYANEKENLPNIQDIKNIKTEIEGLDSKIKNAKKARSEFDTLSKELENFSGIKEKRDKIIKAIANIKTKVTELKFTISESKTKLAILTKKINLINTEISNRKISELRREATDYLSKNASVSLREITMAKAALTSKIQDEQSSLSSFSIDFRSQTKQIHELTIEIKGLTTKIQEARDFISKESGSSKEKLNELYNHLEESRNALNSLRDQESALKTEESKLMILLRNIYKANAIQKSNKIISTNQRILTELNLDELLSIKSTIDTLKTKIAKSESFENICKGEIRQLDLTKTTREKEFAEYDESINKYNRLTLDIRMTEISLEDVNKSIVALEKSILEFHSNKIDEVNAMLRELWASTYSGNDIDKIELISELTNTAYNYKLIMTKNNQELEMKGRCSAGQKMIASIIFRIALAECFSNSNVLALDEPTTNLDRNNSERLAETLCELVQQKKNMQLIIITHDEEFVSNMNRVGVERIYRTMKKPSGVSYIKSVGIDS